MPSTSHPRRIAALLAATAAIVATVAATLFSSASAQDPATRTLTLHELAKGSTFVHVRNTPAQGRQSNLMGDEIVFTNPLTDASGAHVGLMHAACVTTVGARDFRKSAFLCTVVLHLRDGELTGQFLAGGDSAVSGGTITGGTGAYANARGVVASQETRKGSDDTITLVD